MSMTELADKLMQCYDSRELPSWYEIYDASTRLATLSRQLAEAQGQRDAARDYVLIVESERDNAEARLAEAQGVIERLTEDRARFPDRPDDVGRMIGAHIGNLKAGKEAADEHARNAFDKLHRAKSDGAAALDALNYVADMTYCGKDAEWHFKRDYDPQRVLDVLALHPAPVPDSEDEK